MTFGNDFESQYRQNEERAEMKEEIRRIVIALFEFND